jgi:nitroimidazol reductase NimA-like FMN-containing flavoprotein (pyridoxamine 5'-phosphate oxidase superfamily)
VCFQVDAIDPEDETGWSVLVKGRAAEVVDEGELRRLAELPLRYWSIGEKVHWVRVTAREVTGRRIWKGNGIDRTAG